METIVDIKTYAGIGQMEMHTGFKFIQKHGHNLVFKKEQYYIYIEPKENGEHLGQMIHATHEDLFMEPPSFYKEVINNIWKGKIKWRVTLHQDNEN